MSRDALLQQIVGPGLQERKLEELVGVLGVGKTYLLRQLGRSTLTESMLQVRMSIDEYDPGHEGEVGDKASVGAVQASFQSYRRFLSDLLDKVAPAESIREFDAAVAATYHVDVLGRRARSIDESVEELTKKLSTSDLAQAWRQAADDVSKLFVERWNRTPNRQPLLLLLDNVDIVADQELGLWLGKLLSDLQQTFTVVTRQPNGGQIPLCGPWHTFEVGNLDPGEVKSYLVRHNKGRNVPDSVTLPIYEVTEGHPATLTIVQRLIWGDDGRMRQDAKALLDNVTGPQVEKVALLVERLLECRNDDLLRQAVWASAIPRSVSATLLTHLLGDEAGGDATMPHAVSELEALPFVERTSDESGSFRLHPFVRNSLLAWMAHYKSARLTALHNRAADYYGSRLRKEQDKDVDDGVRNPYDDRGDLIGAVDNTNCARSVANAISYAEAFAFEDPEWQALKREWLYHSGFASADRRRSFLVEFAGVFFDAFWWWGNYVHLDFCDELLADLSHLADRRNPTPRVNTVRARVDPENLPWPDLHVMHNELQTFLNAYPLRSVKPRGNHWDSVEDSLLAVAALCELPPSPDVDAPQAARHLAGLVNIFLAHCGRYRDWDSPSVTQRLDDADRRYAAAADFFMGNDTWSPNWVAFERADMAYERASVAHERTDRGHVKELWRKAAEEVQPDEAFDPADVDYELTSNLHRLRGDCEWTDGNWLRAAECYGRAVLHSYLFNFGGSPGEAAPDLYTLQYYVDIRAHAINRLREFMKDHTDDMETAVDCAIRMSQTVNLSLRTAPATDPEQVRMQLEEGTALPLALMLFPRGPDVTELEEKHDSEFARLFRRQFAKLDFRQLLRDLHNPAWL